MMFIDRRDAGKKLAAALARERVTQATVVLALPRGGVPVAFEISHALGLPLDVMLVRKLGVPGHEELAMGAIASGGVRVMNDDIVASLAIQPSAVASVVEREEAELTRRERAYRGDKLPLSLIGRTVILVDDGCATGANMLAAVRAVGRLNAGRCIVAVPVAARTAFETLKDAADHVICLHVADWFAGVGAFYQDFAQISDAEVRAILFEAEKSAKTTFRGAAP